MSAASRAPLSFSLLNSPGDTIVALVLLEGSCLMLQYWHEIRTYYLPVLLGEIRASNPSTAMNVIWQLTSDPPGHNWGEMGMNVPDFKFDPAANFPVAPETLFLALERLKNTYPREKGFTHHLITVAVSPPTSLPTEATSVFTHPQAPVSISLPETWLTVAIALAHSRTRIHMILNADQALQTLRNLHTYILEYQQSSAVPPWFTINPRRFTIHLSPEAGVYGNPHDPPMRPVSGSSRIMPSGSTLPQESPSNNHSTSPSPPTQAGGNRRIRSKVHEPLITMSPGSSTGPGLVNYLKQLHGLTKKRNYGPKASKRNSAAEPSRASGSRPILPRLSLPASSAQVPTWPVGSPKVTPPQSAAETSTSVVNQRYTSIAPAKRARPTSPGAPAEQEDGRGRRWPWIKPGSISPPVKEPTQGTSTDHALRSLEAIPPKPPALAMRLPDEIEPPIQHASPTVYDTGHAQTTLPSPHEQPPTYPAYGSYSEPSSQHHEEQTFSHSAANNNFPTLNSAFTSGTQTYSGMNGYHYNPPIPSSSQPPAPHMDSLRQPSSSALSYQPDYGYSPSGFAPAQHDYGVSPTSSHHSHNGTPLHSPSLTSPVGPAVDEGEDQPFVITPEYEAFANAQFAEAVRSGAMQASMTPGVLTPSVAGPYPQSGGYFADPMLQHQETMTVSNPALQQGTMLSHPNYTYAGSSYAGPSRDDAFYHQAPGMAVPEAGSSHAYYTHGDDPSAQHPQWYGLP